MSTPKWLKHPERIPSGYMWESVKEHKKLKREHAMMKRFFTARNWADRHEAFKIIRCKMPKLFKE